MPKQTRECTVPNPRFKVGDTVTRHIDVYDFSKGKKIGKVIRCYAATSNYGSGPINYPELYDVQFNDGTKQRGFFDYGISLFNL